MKTKEINETLKPLWIKSTERRNEEKEEQEIEEKEKG